MKRHLKMPIAMGAMLGLMVPWMMHGDGTAGALFILGHVAVVGALTLLTLLVPSIRQKLAGFIHHRPKPSHVLPAAIAFSIGWAATCALCLMIGGQHWT